MSTQAERLLLVSDLLDYTANLEKGNHLAVMNELAIAQDAKSYAAGVADTEAKYKALVDVVAHFLHYSPSPTRGLRKEQHG